MPMPYTYRHATEEFRAFLADVKDEMNLVSDNSAYTAVQGVFLAFRRRLTVDQALVFADMLPAVLRAIFVAGWRPKAPVPFAPQDEMAREAQALRPQHSLTPPTAIRATARALRRAVNPRDFALAMEKLPPEARAFWEVDE